MNYAAPKWTEKLSQSTDFKKTVAEALGDLDGLEVLHTAVMIVTYIRPEKTAGGILLPQISVQEDVFQGKVGLVVKKGVGAFRDMGATEFYGQDVNVGDYVVYRPSDAWPVTIRGVPCRLVQDTSIRMVTADPDIIL